MEQKYSNLFSKYTNNTDGKLLIGETLCNLLDSNKVKNILDVGAGNGIITYYLANKFNRVVAIEPKPDLVLMINSFNKSNINVVQSNIQDFETNEKFDIILLSYFLDTIDNDDWNLILKKLERFLSNDGRIICITYLEGCPWDVFTQYISRKTGMIRSGGFGRVTYRVRELGWDVSYNEILNTKLSGNNIIQLYDNMNFFYKAVLSDYVNNKTEYIKELEKLAISETECFITVKEFIFELLRLK